jgi:agmatinase
MNALQDEGFLLKENFFLPHNFLGIPKEYTQCQSSKFLILPIPYEQTTSFVKGTKDSPKAIIDASKQVEFYDEEAGFEPYKEGIFTFPELEPQVSGPQEMVQRIYRVAKKICGEFSPNISTKEKILISLGGEHTITLGLVKAFKEKYKNLSVLQLDAHADLRESYQDSKYSHACVMRRIHSFCSYVGVGIRSISLEESRFAQRNKIKIFMAEGMKDSQSWMEQAIGLLSSEVYLSLDLDFLDPSIMPAVGTPEPGGFLWYETLDFLKRLSQKKKIVGVDIVELCTLPGNIASDFLAAKLIYKLMGYILRGEKERFHGTERGSKKKRE